MRRLFDRVRSALTTARLAMKRRLDEQGPDLELHLAVVGGDPWLTEMLKPSAWIDPVDPQLTIIGPEGGVDPQDTPYVHYRSEGIPSASEPFVQPRLTNPIRFSVPPDLPDDLFELARAASYRDQSGAQVFTPDRHRAYRSAQDSPANRLLGQMAAAASVTIGGAPDQSVTVICVTNRPSQLGNVLANYRRQSYADRQLLLVTNSDSFDAGSVRDALATVPRATLLEIPEQATLGECLNEAVGMCSTRYAAKFDDDDDYGVHYLADTLIAHRFARAGVVGKHSYYARLHEPEVMILRFPGHEFRYTSFVAGGTLTMDLSITRDVPFPPRSIAEDVGFLRDCRRRGIDVFAADRYNYVQNRNDENTWQVDRGFFVQKSEPVPGDRVEQEVWV